MKRLASYLLLTLYLLVSSVSLAQETFSPYYNVSYVTMDDGLLNNYIDDIYKDRLGFLWISTAGGGLSRYDGYEFIHYNTNTERVKLRSNFIKQVCEDNFNRLWILSEGGLDILDINTGLLVDLDNKLLPGITEQANYSILKDVDGNLWLVAGNTLYKVCFDADGSIREIFTLPNIPVVYQQVAMCDLDHDGEVWVALGYQVCKFSEGEGNTLTYTKAAVGLDISSEHYILSIQEKENELWLGTNLGLFRYDRNRHTLKQYNVEPGNPRSLSQNHVNDFAITQDRQLLISTLNGLNIYNPISDDFDHINQDKSSSLGVLNINFINCLLSDGDIIWVGTESGGINKMTSNKLFLRNYFHDKENPYSLSRNPVNVVYEDNQGVLWVGTVEGGLNRKLPNSDRFTHYTTNSSTALSHNAVSEIIEDPMGRLWVGTWGNGITLVDKLHPERPALAYINRSTHPDFSIAFIGKLCYDALNNGIWIGCNPGLYFYDLATDSLIRPLPDGASDGVLGSIGSSIDGDNRLWVGSIEGVYVVDLTSRNGNQFQYRYLRNKLDDPDSPVVEKITTTLLASDSTYWLGSNGYGFYKFIPDEEFGRFECYTTADGLINNTIRGILEDDAGRLWISTNNGISCFDPQTRRFVNYTTEDGLLANQYYWNAYCRSQSGLLYFGNINGLTSIDPNRINERTIPESITLTKLWVANREITPDDSYIDVSISTARRIVLHESDKSFSLEFSALNFEPHASAVYSYYLEGFDVQWIDVPATRRFASYTNLPAGEYTFHVKYIPEGKLAKECPTASIEIKVKPFFYKTYWFILLVLFLLACIVYYWYNRRILALKRQQEMLHQKVEQRTAELKSQKQILEEQTEELSRQNDVLIDQNEKITRQKQQIIEMSNKVQELTVDKLSFFTNITHEFRTPITLIIGPIERALKLSTNPKVIEQLNFVERNSKYLLSLVNQLMDFRKVESGNLEINRRPGNFQDFIHNLTTPFLAFARERNIELRTLLRLRNPNFSFDPDALQKVISNLLSNAIKFTPDGGQVTLYITSFYDSETGQEQLYIGVKDTGVGVPEKDMENIFGRFYQSRDNMKFPVYGQSGTGIGLYLSKRIVNMHGGSINLKNNHKQGATFYIVLPLLREEAALLPDRENLPEAAKEKVSEGSSFVPDRLTILVVEDNRDMRRFILSILLEHYNVMEAENGVEALNLLTTHNVDFIVSDLMMPLMDGLELSKRVKANFAISHIPFLMLTAKTDEESRVESYKTGVDSYLQKPFNEDLLLARIHNILENRKRYHQKFSLDMEINDLPIEEESSDKKFVKKAMDVMKANYTNSDFESADFIEAMGVSKTLLNKKLQSLVGQSIGQFMRNYRLNIARELLEQSKVTQNLKVSEIAYEVGFNDPKYFTRCFTKRFNAPPSQFLASGE